MTKIMKICVVGNDARADVFAQCFRRHGHDVIVCPGRPGIEGSAPDTTPEELAQSKGFIDLYMISAETPLVDGLADRLRELGAVVFGPGADGAQLEGSKVWMKQLLQAALVPTAEWAYGTMKDLAELDEFVEVMEGLVAVKTDGLAAGKGVEVCFDVETAKIDVRSKTSGEAFGDAGRTVVVEQLELDPNDPHNPEYYELSVIVATDGQGNIAVFPIAQDFKRLRDGNEGPNTGGMGSFSPVPSVSEDLLDWIVADCIQPVVDELIIRGIDYRGFLFCGLMITPDDGPKVLEYNVRFGDPEAQSVLPRIKSDLAQVLYECATGELKSELVVNPNPRVAVVLAAHGYAEWDKPQAGDVIMGLERARQLEHVTVFCAGTGEDADGNLVTAGGRVLTVVGEGTSADPVAAFTQARNYAYRAALTVNWNNKQYRADIGPPGL